MNDRRNFLRTTTLASANAVLTAKLLDAGDNTAPDGAANKPKRIYIAADDHTDYMWTADEATYRDVFLETIDHYLDLADQTDSLPPDQQSRWNCDGLLWLIEYERHRSPQQLARLIDRIRSGHLSVPMTVLVSCYGGMPTEAAIRGLYPAGRVARQHRLDLTMAVAMENQTLPLGLATLWAGSGVKYSWRGICACASKIASPGRRKHDVYWWVGPDGSRILMKWYSMAPPVKKGVYGNEGPGGYAEARYARAAIEYVDTNPGFRNRNPHDVIGLFGQGWDDLKTIVPLSDSKRSFPAIAKEMSRDGRRVIVSNEEDYFQDFEKHYGDSLPEVRHSLGNEWELYTASLAEVSASVKRAVDSLRTAEALATLANWIDAPGHDSETQLLILQSQQQAWIAMGLYWEHDWTADGPISRQKRAAWQRRIAAQITGYVERLTSKTLERISDLSTSQDDTWTIINPLLWERSDIVRIEIPRTGEYRVVDGATGMEVASQCQLDLIASRDRKRTIQFVAKNIPPLGQHTYRLVSTQPPSETRDRNGEPSNVNAGKHSLRINPNGSISDWRTKDAAIAWMSETQLANHLEKSKGKLSFESAGPVSTTIVAKVLRPIRRQTRITVYETLDRIDIENVIEESFSDVQTWTFDFNLESPTCTHEEVGAVVRAATVSQGGDYADTNSRTDWLTLNHFVRLDSDQGSITLANRDCLFFHLGDDHDRPMQTGSSVVKILAGGQVDGPDLGIPHQGGDKRFVQRFSLWGDPATASPSDPPSPEPTSPAPTSPAPTPPEPTLPAPTNPTSTNPTSTRSLAMRRSIEVCNPLVVIPGRGWNGEKDVGLRCNNESVIPWAIKPSEPESGGGTIVRLWNVSDQPQNFELTLPAHITKAMATTHIETDIEPLEIDEHILTGRLAAGGFQTMRLFS